MARNSVRALFHLPRAARNGAGRVGLRNAPSNTSLAILAIGFGPCTSPGINLGFCNNLLVSFAAPGPLTVFIPTPAAGGTCGLNLNVPLSIPVNKALCNFRLSFQWVVGCRPSGTGVTNCRGFTIVGD